MGAGLRFQLRPEGIRQLMEPGSEASRFMDERAKGVVKRAKNQTRSGRVKAALNHRNGPTQPDIIEKHVGTFKGGRGLAQWEEEGTRPHPIVPKKAQRLVFFWDKVGALVFARKVNHPGTQPHPFLKDAARAEGFNVSRRSR